MSLDRVVTARAGLLQHPALLHELDAADIAAHDAVLQTRKRHQHSENHAGLNVSVFQVPPLAGEFRPIFAYLFTEGKCNLDRH